MFRLMRAELLKLKRSGMVWVGVAGAVVMPLFAFFSYYKNHIDNGKDYVFPRLLTNNGLFMSMGIGVMLFGLMASFLFNREYKEGTIKTMMVLPIRRSSFILTKIVLLGLWVLLLTLIMYVVLLSLGLVFKLTDMTGPILIEYLGKYFLLAVFSFALTLPVCWITLLTKNYIPGIAFTIVMMFFNIFIMQSKYVCLFPYSASFRVLFDSETYQWPVSVSIAVIVVTGIAGLLATLIHFVRKDIQ